MPGFTGITGDEEIMFADNCSFDGTERGGKMTTNGELWIGSTLSPHVKKGSLTSPLGTITIGYSSPNITLEANNTVETWSDISGTQTLTNNSNYFVTGASTLTLPAAPSNGSKIQIIVKTNASVVITANTGQTIQLSANSSSVAGTFTNSLTGDTMSLRYRVADTSWTALTFVGAWTPA